MRSSSSHGPRFWLALAMCGAAVARAAPATAAEAVLALRDGEPSDDAAVVALIRTPVVCGSLPRVRCTGTLVAPRAVLTAAHCLEGFSPATIGVADGADLAAAPRLHAVAELLPHPAYDAETAENDLALVLLDAPISDVAPLPIAAEALGTTDVGRSLRLVGYGHPGFEPIDGMRRQGVTRVDTVTEATIVTVPGPALACDGDSGGPLLAFGADGVERVVGVVSWGDAACWYFAGSTQLARQDEFLGPALARAAVPTNSPSPTSCVDATPEPAPSDPAAPAPPSAPAGCGVLAAAEPGGWSALALLLVALPRRRPPRAGQATRARR